MEREAARQQIRSSWREILSMWGEQAKTNVNGEPSWVCPICGHGNGGDGLTFDPRSADRNGLKCFGCGFYGDILDLYSKATGSDHNRALVELGAMLGITVGKYDPNGETASSLQAQRAERTEQIRDPGRDQTAYYNACRERLSDPAAVAYLNRRGISYDTAKAYGLGYDPAADPAEAGHPAPRIIIPSTLYHYAARSIDPAMPYKYRTMNNKGAEAGIFGLDTLTGSDPVFVVEGAFDALAVSEAGGKAVALNGTGNAGKLADQLLKHGITAPVIISLDNDSKAKTNESVRQTERDLAQDLGRVGIRSIIHSVSGDHKDPDDYLIADRDKFKGTIREALKLAETAVVQVSEDAFPEPIPLSEALFENPPELAPELINGVLRCGHKMLLSGSSKAGKSYLLMELAVALAEGASWLGFPCRKSKILYVNLEIDSASCQNRFLNIYNALGAGHKHISDITLWNLRGRSAPLDKLVPMMIEHMNGKGYSAVIVDPIYKTLTGDENSASDMAYFCNQFDRICTETGCAVIYAHHHSKGAQGGKRAMDRASGSGVFARDPDAQLDITELELSQDLSLKAKDLGENATAWRLECSLREFPNFKPRDFWFVFPLHKLDTDGDLSAMGAAGSIAAARAKNPKNDKTLDQKHAELMEAFHACKKNGAATLRDMAEYMGVNQKTVKSWNLKTGEKLSVCYGTVTLSAETEEDDMAWAE